MKPTRLRHIIRYPLLTAAIACLFASQSAMAADFLWDANPGAAGAQDGSELWDNITNNWISGGANTTYVSSSSNTATFGNSDGMAGGITLLTAQAAGTLTLNAPGSGNYSFSGAALTLGTGVSGNIALVVNKSATFSNVVNVSNSNSAIQFATLDQTLGFSGGGSILTAANGPGISGTSTAIAKSSSINVTGGLYTANGTATWNIGDGANGTRGISFTGATTSFAFGGINIANNNSSNVSFTNGAQVSANQQVQVGRGNSSNVGRITVDGGTFKANANATGDVALLIGRDKGVGIFDQKAGRTEVIGAGITNTSGGGVLGLNVANSGAADGSGKLNVSGGTMVVKDLRLNSQNQHAQAGSTQGSSTVNLSGGSLYIGGTVTDVVGAGTGAVAGGFSNRGTGTSTYAVNLSGGTLGANAAWSSNLNMSLVSGISTIKAADEANAAQNITLSGNLTGAGALNKSGGGSLLISGATTTYSGGTTATAGALATSTTGSFGTGNVSISATILTLGNSASIADVANLMFDGSSTIDLAFSGVETLNSLGNSTTSTFAEAGQYTASQLNTRFGGTFFTGGGSILVGAVPEPSTVALLGLGLLGLLRRRR